MNRILFIIVILIFCVGIGFSNAEVSRIIDSNHWLETVEDHYRLKFPAKKKDVRDYFYQSFHIMVGDVEKIVVLPVPKSHQLRHPKG